MQDKKVVNMTVYNTEEELAKARNVVKQFGEHVQNNLKKDPKPIHFADSKALEQSLQGVDQVVATPEDIQQFQETLDSQLSGGAANTDSSDIKDS